MSQAVENNLIDQLVEFEKRGRTLTPANDALRKALERRVERGQIASPFKGQFARREYWNELDQNERTLHIIRTLSAENPSWVFCFSSAALVHGMDVSHRLSGQIHIVASHSKRVEPTFCPSVNSRHRVVRHAFNLAEDDIVDIDGIRVTSLHRTVFDCTRLLSFPLALGIADSAMRILELDRSSILDHASDQWARCRGIRRFKATIEKANPLSENGGESYARAIMLENGVMEPLLQVEITDPFDRRRIYRIDYLWEHLIPLDVGGELDGLQKIMDPRMLAGKTPELALRLERERESHLSSNLRIARFTFPEVRAVRPLINLLDGFGVPRTSPDGLLLQLKDPLLPANRQNPYAMLR